MSELRKLITLVTPETESGPFKFDGGSFQDNLTERLQFNFHQQDFRKGKKKNGLSF